ncbi:DUF4296 domain-containing protein [Aequorivita sp. F47161]|uniref:DUF4296 domain-containing protein n=1 Tax=Aequorivita vitellina TaxID=2874475 RepID=A0A9X1QTA9_9FLAO|nr:DUF4296 domain-containing protein [Aequorivita vitellina]MCG2417990.1 DUF4296 domain-containing protein [Aequorivita vitellina]
MKYWFFVFVCILSFVGCQNVEQPKKPKNLISKEKMVDILTESYMANAARSVNNQTIIERGVVLDSLIYGNFGVDSLQFAESNAFYAADINTYMEIFQKVESRLAAKQQKMDSLRQVKRALKDSISTKDFEEINEAEPLKDSLI